MSAILNGFRRLSQKIPFMNVGKAAIPVSKPLKPLEIQNILLMTELQIANFEKGCGDIIAGKKSIVDFNPAGIVDGLCALNKAAPDEGKLLGDRVNVVYQKLYENKYSPKLPSVPEMPQPLNKYAFQEGRTAYEKTEEYSTQTTDDYSYHAPVEERILDIQSTIDALMFSESEETLEELASLVDQLNLLEPLTGEDQIKNVQSDLDSITKELKIELEIAEKTPNLGNLKYIEALFAERKDLNEQLMALKK